MPDPAWPNPSVCHRQFLSGPIGQACLTAQKSPSNSDATFIGESSKDLQKSFKKGQKVV
jgi:hypothetical protein